MMMSDCRLRAGIFGTMLPLVIYAAGSPDQQSNASLTLTNVTVVYDLCISDVWQPLATVVSEQPQVHAL